MGVFCLFSCQGNSRLKQALELVGDNRGELEKVLTHYRDSGLKQEAARFLISNMPGCQGTDSLSLERFQSVYDAYDAISRASDYRTDKAWGERIDSLSERCVHQFGMPATVKDLQHVKADYLIREIDRSFQAWQRNVYAKDASFEDFCEYVLPYRRLNGLVADAARDTFYHRHGGEYYAEEGKDWLDETDSLLHEYRHLTHSGFHGTRIPIQCAATFELLRHGLCMHRCWYNSLLLSSLGMPVAIDFVPAWGNRNNSHTWNVVLVDGKSYAFEAFCKFVYFAKGTSYRGYLCYTYTKNHVYLVYEGTNGTPYRMDNLKHVEIFKLDWNGNLLCNYQLDKHAFAISVDVKEEYLYACCFDSYEGEIEFIKYELK